jgi:AhpD family alkylhydroperoxidase
MSITKKEKELASVGISIAAGCKPCTDYHLKAVREAGATDNEIRRAIEDAVALRSAATSIMKYYGRSHLGEAEHEEVAAKPQDRVAELIGIGAAFAVNCVSSLENYSRYAESVGVTREEILEIAKLAKFIKERGASHVDRWAESLEQGKAPLNR